MQSKKTSVILTCDRVIKKLNNFEILKKVNLSISRGEKIGLVGANGSGKTTLLKILAGLLTKDSGVISYSPNLKIKYFPQIHSEKEKLSGGEIAKKTISSITSSGADLFLLDEPTNNLDHVGLNMMEIFILKSRNTFLIVSHDREFLDKVVDKIVEIDHITKSSTIYNGNYSKYIVEKKAEISRQWKLYTDKLEKTNKFEKSKNQRLSWMKKIETKRKNIKKLPIHEKEKPLAAVLRDKEADAGRRAKLIKNKLERYKENTEEITKPIHLLPLKIAFEHNRGSTKVFELKNVEKIMRSKRIGPINLSIQYGQRLHIIGKNGSGKTTLIRLLVGEIKPDNGVIAKGKNVKIVYIPQKRHINNSNVKVVESFLKDTALKESEARKVLNRFRITTEDVSKKISTLSPGEYSRFIIAKMVAVKSNCIILDEPSNHLDLEVLTELENGLKDYEGTLIVVSHDRYFVKTLQLNSVLDMDKL